MAGEGGVMPVNQTCPENEENPANKAGWVKVKLGDICSYDLGKTPKRDNPAYWKKEAGSVPWVKIADMSEHSVITETSEKISELAFREVFRGQIVPAGTLLMSFKLTIGRVAYLGIPACHNEAIISIYPKEEVDKYYLGYFLSQVNYSGIFDRAVKGNTLNKKKIARIPVLLPPLSEQKQISALLGTIEKAIALERRCEASLTTIKRAALHVVFTKGLHNEAQRETPLGLVPESWETRELGLVCEYDRRNTGDITLPYLGMEQMESGTGRITGKLFPTKTESSSFLFNSQHVLFGRLRPYLQKVWLPDQEGRCSTEIFPIKPKSCLERRFLFYWLLRDEIIRKINATCTGTRMPRANMNEVLRFPFPIPPLHEQQEIVDFLTTLDQKLEIHRRKRACLENIFRLFLYNLTRGTLRLTEFPEGCF